MVSLGWKELISHSPNTRLSTSFQRASYTFTQDVGMGYVSLDPYTLFEALGGRKMKRMLNGRVKHKSTTWVYYNTQVASSTACMSGPSLTFPDHCLDRVAMVRRHEPIGPAVNPIHPIRNSLTLYCPMTPYDLVNSP